MTELSSATFSPKTNTLKEGKRKLRIQPSLITSHPSLLSPCAKDRGRSSESNCNGPLTVNRLTLAADRHQPKRSSGIPLGAELLHTDIDIQERWCHSIQQSQDGPVQRTCLRTSQMHCQDTEQRNAGKSCSPGPTYCMMHSLGMTLDWSHDLCSVSKYS